MTKLYLFMGLLLSVSCGKNDFLTQANEDFTQAGIQIQKIGEHVGRVPRIVGNLILGTSPDTEKDLQDLEKEVDKVYKQFLSNYTKVLSELAKVARVSEDHETALEDLNNDLETLTDAVNDLDSDNLQAILELNTDVLTLFQKLQCAKNARGLNRVKACL